MPSQVFDKGRRLLTSADYSRVFEATGHKVSHRHYLILARANRGGCARLGLVISKKNVRLATRRNRIKRVARETFRVRDDLDSLDIVFLARRGFDTLPDRDQTRLMSQAWSRLAQDLGKAG